MKKILFLTVAILTPILTSACFGVDYYDRGYGMMGSGYGGPGFLMTAIGLVWLTVGILAGVWLWQNINKKNDRDKKE